MFFYVFIIYQVLVLSGVVCEYCKNRSLRLYQQASPRDLVDGELAQKSRACVNVIFITWENLNNSLYPSQKTKDVQVYKNSPSLCTTNINMHIHIWNVFLTLFSNCQNLNRTVGSHYFQYNNYFGIRTHNYFILFYFIIILWSPTAYLTWQAIRTP
jgi:hypothetical protein